MSSITDVVRNFPAELQDPILEFWSVIKDELGVKREDFTELKKIVSELAMAQKQLADAQNELAEAQKETEKSINRLSDTIDIIAEAQKETEKSIKRLSDTIDFKIGGLGRRWGIDSESLFRNGLAEILSETGYVVNNYVENDSEGFVSGRPAEIELDIIVKGEKTIIVEITSSVSKSDIFIFMRKNDFYRNKTGRNPDKLLMITPYIDDTARDIAHQNGILICDSLSHIGPSIQNI